MKPQFKPLALKPSYNIKAQRTFTVIRKYAFFFTLLVALGGLYEPKLGLLVIPVMIGLVLASFFKGRFWCGNICAHGSLFDSLLLPVSRNVRIPGFFKWKIFSLAFFTLFTYKLVSRFIMIAGLYGSSSFWDKIGLVFVSSYLMVTVSGGLLGLIVSPRTWCNFCPMGFMQKASYSVGRKLKVTESTDEKITVSDQNQCHKCGKCARVCPMQLSPYDHFSDKNQFDSVDCLKCSTCVSHCPAGILNLANQSTASFMAKHINKRAGENRRRFDTVLAASRLLADDVREFTFQLKDNDISFTPGQFILVRIQNEPEMFRAFSVSRFNSEARQISVTVKKAPRGFGTDILFNQFEDGMDVVLEGPVGDELILDEDSRKAVFVGGGIGITPFLPLVQDAVEDGAIDEVKLIYGVNKENEILYREEFEALEKKHDKFEFIKVVAFDDKWKGEKGFVTDVMERLDLDDRVIYMCGPKPMINASLNKLEQLGVAEEAIRYESA
ncbi:MAG: 4Fe-4S binding protein [Spirochaetales bacterium]|nr:4Fe-4S binding protein [Spirochaetales bacterium]